MVIAGIMVGIAEAFFWVPLGFIFIYFGKWYSHYSKKEEKRCIKEFSGILFAAFQWNAVSRFYLISA